MFRRNLNRAVLHLRIETVSPLIIRAGDSGLDPVAPDLACVRTRVSGRDATVYIPGASLKGVLRSAAEAAVRGRTWSSVDGACDLFSPRTCGRSRRVTDEPSDAIHKSHCLACRLFGSTSIRGRAAVRDLYPWDPGASDEQQRESMRSANLTETRHGVAINRFSGSVEHGPFESEIVPMGSRFWGEIALVNYQAWQLGLLAESFRELNDGFAQLGSTKSRGFGRVVVSVERIVHEQTRSRRIPAGVGLLATESDRAAYGLLSDTELPETQVEDRGLFLRATVEAPQTEAWLAAGIDALGALA